MENDNTVLLNPPLFALDKDAPMRYAGMWALGGWVTKVWCVYMCLHERIRMTVTAIVSVWHQVFFQYSLLPNMIGWGNNRTQEWWWEDILKG